MSKEKQPLMVDLEQGIQLTSFTDNEPPEWILDRTKDNEIGSGNVGRWSEGFRHRSVSKHETVQEANVWATTKQTKPGSSYEFEIPGLWPSSFDMEHCCIYRVPSQLRRVKPEAYTPKMLLIGPLHHSKKAEALKLSKSNLRYLDYTNMELHKTKYLNDIVDIYGDQIIEEFKKIIKRDEKVIRESYAESTDWIKSQEFVDMILLDSVFILWLFIQIESTQVSHQFMKGDMAGSNIPRQRVLSKIEMGLKGDILFAQPLHLNTILEDLVLLENQLPFVLLEKLFEIFFLGYEIKETLRNIVLRTFGLESKIKEEVKFRHFTDMFRRVHVETLCLTEEQNIIALVPPMNKNKFHNADKLDSAGVDFVNVDEGNDHSLMIKFEGGILKMPCFLANPNNERFIRNLMALEQCHYPFSAYICDYIGFLDFLIKTEEDVDLLEMKGVLDNGLGHQGLVTEMVSNLSLGQLDFGSHYYHIAENLNKHYESRINRSVATLRRVYFKDLWTGTATVAAVFILLLTLIGTVSSVLQVTQNDNKSPPPMALARGP